MDSEPGALIGAFAVGLLLLNAVPHLVAGVTGLRFQTPFSRPSSPVVNVLWAAANVAAGAGLLYWSQPEAARLPAGLPLAALGGGALLMALALARTFSRAGQGYG